MPIKIGAVAGFVGGFVMGLVSGLSPGNALLSGFKGALFGGIGAAAAFGVADYISSAFPGIDGHAITLLTAKKAIGYTAALTKSILHGIVRGAINVIQSGGKFLSSFASGFVSSAFSVGRRTFGEGAVAARTAIMALVGGVTSSLTGGKFLNGAVSAAFVHLFNAEARISVSGSGGAGAGGTVEFGVSVAYDEESNEPWWKFWKKLSVQPYRTVGGGAYADASVSLEVNIGVSNNNSTEAVLGSSTTVGASYDTGLPVTPDVGYEMAIPADSKYSPLHNFNAGVSFGVPNPIETHLYRTKTYEGWW